MEHALAPVNEPYRAREDRFDNPALINSRVQVAHPSD
jgi:hypothetical protein